MWAMCANSWTERISPQPRFAAIGLAGSGGTGQKNIAGASRKGRAEPLETLSGSSITIVTRCAGAAPTIAATASRTDSMWSATSCAHSLIRSG